MAYNFTNEILSIFYLTKIISLRGLFDDFLFVRSMDGTFFGRKKFQIALFERETVQMEIIP